MERKLEITLGYLLTGDLTLDDGTGPKSVGVGLAYGL